MALTQVTTGGVDENINIDSNTLKVDGTNNRVGIGTATPSNILSIAEAGGPTVRLTDSTSGAFGLIENGSNGDLTLSADHGNTGASTNIIFKSDGATERMRISGGNVGIGATAPTTPLSVRSSSTISTYGDVSAQFSDNSTGTLYVQHSSGKVQLGSDSALAFGSGTSATERMRIRGSDGRLLIGTTETSVHADRLIEMGNTSRSGTYASITTSATGTGGILFADTTTNDTGGYRGIIDYAHQIDAMRFYTQASERFRIDNAGSIGVGGIAPSKGSFFGGTQNVLHIAGSTAPEIRLQSSASGQADLCIFASNSVKKSHVYSRATNGAITFDVTDSSGNLKQDVLQVIGSGIARGSASQGFAPSNGSAMFTGYHSGSFRLGFDCFTLPGNAWFTQSLLFFFGSVQGGLTGNTHGMAHIRLTGLSSWGLSSTSIIQGGSLTVASANTSSNHIDLDFTFNSGMRGPVSFWVQTPNNAIPEITFTG